MDLQYYKQYEPLFNAWYIKKLIGEGSFGQVYEIERNDFGQTYKAALKTITIPQNQSEIRSVMADGMSKQEMLDYFKGAVEEIVSEFTLLSKLKGHSNIVSYEDHVVIEHKDGVGWDILIRMELLTPVFELSKNTSWTRQEAIKLGIDMCKALELCQKYKIVHRDLKPENIFVSENGDYKLGDFGIARTVEKTCSGLSRKGTYTYMAPEIYRGEAYGSTVDIYSLGLVLYRLLNQNRTPFLPLYPNAITHNDRDQAIMKRIRGQELPPPVNADEPLAQVILKACAYDPKERYRNAAELREDLELLLAGGEPSTKHYQEEEAAILEQMKVDQSKPMLEPDKTEYTAYTDGTQGDWKPRRSKKKQKKRTRGSKKKLIILIAVLLALCAAAAAAYALLGPGSAKVTDITGIDDYISMKVGEEKQLYPVLKPAEYQNEKVRYSIDDEDIAAVSDSGTLSARHQGQATLTVEAGGYKKTAAVSVSGDDQSEQPARPTQPPTKAPTETTKVKETTKETTRATQPQTTQSPTTQATEPTQPDVEEPADDDDE